MTSHLNSQHQASRWFAATIAGLASLALFGSIACAAGHAKNDVVEFGSDINIPADQVVTGDVIDFGGSVSVHGRVMGSAVVFGGDLHIYPEGEVLQDTVDFGGDIINESRTTPPKKHGKVVPLPMPSMPVETPAPEMSMPTTPDEGPSFREVWTWFLVADFLLTLLAFFLFPLRTRNVEDTLRMHALASVLVGFPGMLIVFPLLLLVLTVLIVTIPLIPVVLIAVALAYLVGKAAIASLIGRGLLEAARVVDPRPLASVLVGLFVLLLLTGVLPEWIDIVLYFVIGGTATGAALVSFMRTRPGLLGPPPAPAYVPAPVGYPPPSGPAPSGPPAIRQ